MMKVILTILLLAPALACYAREKPDLNPADYSISVHVQSSRLNDLCAPGCIWVQHVNVLIDGKKFELSDTSPRTDLLRIGDYKAKVLKDETGHSFEYQRTYEFLMPDGELRKFVVVGETE